MQCGCPLTETRAAIKSRERAKRAGADMHLGFITAGAAQQKQTSKKKTAQWLTPASCSKCEPTRSVNPDPTNCWLRPDSSTSSQRQPQPRYHRDATGRQWLSTDDVTVMTSPVSGPGWVPEGPFPGWERAERSRREQCGLDLATHHAHATGWIQ